VPKLGARPEKSAVCTQDANFGTPQPSRRSQEEKGSEMIMHRNIAEWHGKQLVDRDGDKIGKLEDVYVDVETDEPMFGTVKEGVIGRHLTFVPLGGITIGPGQRAAGDGQGTGERRAQHRSRG
jgi:PRC-barrel domain